MKKIALIIILFCFAKSLQAQTKEETIAWLKEKISKYGRVEKVGAGYKTLNTLKVDGDMIIQERSMDFNDGKGYYLLEVFKVNLNDIIGSLSGYISTNGLKISRWEREPGGKINYDDFVSENPFFQSNSFNLNAEPDLEKRFYKALDKLCEYNKMNIPKEAF